jgi:hypothetical protein
VIIQRLFVPRIDRKFAFCWRLGHWRDKVEPAIYATNIEIPVTAGDGVRRSPTWRVSRHRSELGWQYSATRARPRLSFRSTGKPIMISRADGGANETEAAL